MVEFVRSLTPLQKRAEFAGKAEEAAREKL